MTICHAQGTAVTNVHRLQISDKSPCS